MPLILGSSQKPNIPLPSIVPKAETLELEQQVNVHELFSPSSPKETPVEQVTEQTNKTTTDDQENISADMAELVEQEEGKIDFFFDLCLQAHVVERNNRLYKLAQDVNLPIQYIFGTFFCKQSCSLNT